MLTSSRGRAGWTAASLTCMANGDAEPPVEERPEERPATWENVVVGEAKELAGRALGNDELAEEGEEQVAIAHEVHDEYEEEHGK